LDGTPRLDQLGLVPRMTSPPGELNHALRSLKA
jgi:hypothetical protein